MRRQGVALWLGVLLVITTAAPGAATGFDGTRFLDAVGDPFDRFGAAVAVDGTVVVVGAPAKDADTGSAFVFEQQTDGSYAGRRLAASDGVPGHQFGGAVATSGDRVVVGARFADGQQPAAGAVYVFERQADGTWAETKLVASDGATNDGFGGAVAIHGPHVVVGADWEDERGEDAGAAYLFTLVDGAWHETKLVASDGSTGDLYGRSVDVDGERVVVGSLYDDASLPDVGAAYVYGLDDLTETKLTPPVEERVSLFGHAVAIDGDDVVVGAPLSDLGVLDGGARLRLRRGDRQLRRVAPACPAVDRGAVRVQRRTRGRPRRGRCTPRRCGRAERRRRLHLRRGRRGPICRADLGCRRHTRTCGCGRRRRGDRWRTRRRRRCHRRGCRVHSRRRRHPVHRLRGHRRPPLRGRDPLAGRHRHHRRV